MYFDVVTVLIFFITFLIWYYLKFSVYNYWRKLGVPGPNPYLIFGNFPRTLFFKTSITEDVKRVYDEWRKEPFFGVYHGSTPQLIVNDLELVKRILIKDFNVFPGRGVNVPEDADTLAMNIFSLDGHRWKVLRSKLTRAFTTGKLKHMVELMIECADHFVDYLNKEVMLNDVIEVREAAAKFTTDIIGSCAFGINMNAMSREDNEFRKIGNEIFGTNKVQVLIRVLREHVPKVARILEMVGSSKTTHFFVNLIQKTIAYRESEKIYRNDLVDILRDIKDNKDIDIKITDTVLAAQALTFFAAGFETSSTTLSFVLFELALAQDIQETLRQEILQTVKKHGNVSYEVINEMQYLDMVVREILRKHSPAALVTRTSVQPWTIPDTNITLPAATNVWIPIDAFHYDPNYFPNPEMLDPLRFSEKATNIRPMSYLPFGSGPKNCIGDRFASYQVKLGIISILRHFVVKPSASTKVNYELEPTAIVRTMKGGVPLTFKPL